jgi:hypothetical protein
MSDWAAMFRSKCGDIEIPARWGNTEKPTLDPWVVTEAYSGGVTRVVMQRNPYFWQVDQSGQQLPYIDQLNFSIAQDVESLMLDALSGKLDIQERHIDSLQNKPTLSQNMQKGGYRLIELVASGAQQVQIYLNLTHKDPKMREMFANKQFRQALSLGINRKEIIDLVYLGQSEPYQTGPRPGHPWYNEKLARQFTSHDPKQANEILDKLGYDKRDAQKFRLRPDGQKVFFSIDVIPTLYPDAVDTLELVKRHWADIGVDMKVNTIERALYYTRGDSNDHDAATWPGPGGLDPMLDPRDYFAQHTQGSRYAIPWTQWYVSGGKDGQEPPANQKSAHEAVRRRPRDCRPEEARRADEAGVRPVCRRLRDDRRVPGGQLLRHCTQQPAERAQELPERLVLAQPGPGAAAAVLLQPDVPDGRLLPDACWCSCLPSLSNGCCGCCRSWWPSASCHFVLIQLPPGDYVTTYIATLAASNEVVDQNTAADLRNRFGLDQPMVVQYWKWISNIMRSVGTSA